jgi:hypothetical protein
VIGGSFDQASANLRSPMMVDGLWNVESRTPRSAKGF